MHSNLKLSKAVLFAGMLGLSSLSVAGMAIPGIYKIDPEHSSVLFEVNHLGMSDLHGRFNDIAGNFTISKGGPAKVEATIKTASVDTNHKKRDKHLRSPDFFNVKQFPNMVLESTPTTFM